NWCQDENRHGDFFDALMKSQPQYLNTWKARLWCRFFLLAVFGTMYIRDTQEPGFYEVLGIDAREYETYVIQKTNETAGRVFPVMLDVDSPEFYQRLDVCVQNNRDLATIVASKTPKVLQIFQKLPLYTSNAWQLLRLYLMKPIASATTQGVAH
ncbi:MAG: magnesium-protoporphyrin IX monomethyl ester cyclase, partial [Phormidesmis sp. CAN_BIN36]|nr:magnesium-protoporphyrin IX monomethyl ester cyclase [Phormidesmis sp. CAN_BIN36]